jgi:hypothetical protein
MRRNLAESPVSDRPGGGRVSEKGDTRTSEYAGRSGAGDLALRQASRNREERDGRWPRKALEAALLHRCSADLTKLTEWIAEGQRRAERVR